MRVYDLCTFTEGFGGFWTPWKTAIARPRNNSRSLGARRDGVQNLATKATPNVHPHSEWSRVLKPKTCVAVAEKACGAWRLSTLPMVARKLTLLLTW